MRWTKHGQFSWPLHADLILLFAIAISSFVGFGVFRTWPSLLVTIPDAMAVYPRAVHILPRAQILAAFLVLAIMLVRVAGWRWLPSAALIYVASLSSELLGTTVGIPFGPYRYTDALGMKWLGHVPVLIPISWFMMAVPSYALARRLGGASDGRSRRVVTGSLILLAWDLSLDPAMSAATAFWVWGGEGAYYGMPWLNLFGWFATGLVLMAILSALAAEQWIDRVPRPWILGYYAANLALPIGLAVVAGMWWAIAASVVAMWGCWLLVRPPALQRAVA